MAKKSTSRSNYRNEELALEQVYHKAARKSKKKGTVVISAIALLLVLITGVLAGCFSSSELEDGIIMNNVTVAGVDVGGMTKEEAISALRLSVADSYSQNPMVVIIEDQQVELSPELTEVSLDVEAAVEAAYAIGRTGSSSEKKAQQLQASTTGVAVDLQDCLHVNTDAVIAKLNAMNIIPNGEIIQSTWEVVGEAPDLTAEEAPVEAQKLVVHMGVPSYEYDQEALLAQIMDAYASNAFLVEFSCGMTAPDPVDLDAIHAQYYAEPVDAVMDSETFEVVSHCYGYGFDLKSAKTTLETAQYGTDVEIPFVAVAPAQTTEALSSLLFRDVLSSHKATSGSSYNRDNNLKLACKAIDGTIIMPGEIFDYNETTGERTAAKGYLPANGYLGGKTVQMLGGGVCQPSSIIYYCALLADMEIVTRSCHQFISSYMDPGMDATVSWGGPHFRFRNNTDYPIRIDATASGGSVTITIMGTDTKDYYVKMDYEIISKSGWTTEYVEMEADNEDGYEDGDVISTPYTGYTVKTYRCRYSKADDSLIERVYETKSVYDSRNKEIAKIITEETETTTEPSTEPTTPPTTEPPATEPPATEPPATEPPATDPPATDPPATDPPATDPPAESTADATEG